MSEKEGNVALSVALAFFFLTEGFLFLREVVVRSFLLVMSE